MFFYVTGRMLPLLAVSACAADARCGETHAFVDLGANDGQSLQWFRRNWAAPAAAAAQPYNFVAAFEMNSHFSPVLRTELARWPDSALMIGAAWTTNGDMDASMQQPNSRTGYKNGMFYNMTASALMVGGSYSWWNMAGGRRRARVRGCAHVCLVAACAHDGRRDVECGGGGVRESASHARHECHRRTFLAQRAAQRAAAAAAASSASEAPRG